MTETIIVIDFETTGLSPAKGARTTEVAAVKLCDGQIVDTFQSLMNAGVAIPLEIQHLTGINNAMLRQAPPSVQVMAHLKSFLGNYPLVAHNARFDQAFLEAEFALAKITGQHLFCCSMKLARRVYPNAPNYKLATLLDYADIPHSGKAHRALADATATASLWHQMHQDLCVRVGMQNLDHFQLYKLTQTPAAEIERQIDKWR
jgi:DNA polymerase-3 subunit epsilon